MDKRLIALLLLLVAAGAAWHFHHKAEHERFTLQTRALVTAQIWVASVKYRKDEAKFISFRDSALSANYITREEMETYLHQYQSEPEAYNDFTDMVGDYVDSLVKLKDKVSDSAASAQPAT